MYTSVRGGVMMNRRQL